MTTSVPISIGELIDKISILKIKQERIKDHTKLTNINLEHDLLSRILKEITNSLAASQHPQLFGLSVKLKNINMVIWDIEDNIRDHERYKNFGPTFIELARGVYHNNDERAAIKREINEFVGSTIVEEKSYADYKG